MERLVTTKDKILHVLKKNVELSIREMMEHFTISEVAIRRHLNDLIREGFVKEKIIRQEIGRPYHLYSLTSKGHLTFPNQYEHLSSDILTDLEEVGGKEVVDEVLLQRKVREERELATKLRGKNFSEKIKSLIQFQESKGYMVEYTELADGSYEIKNYNCPIYSLASKYKQICQNEDVMYNSLFPQSDVVVQSCITDGENCCSWLITNPEMELQVEKR